MKPNDANERLPTSERPFRILIISGSDRGQPAVRPLRCLHRPTCPWPTPKRRFMLPILANFPHGVGLAVISSRCGHRYRWFASS
jgi:hypothetical protein